MGTIILMPIILKVMGAVWESRPPNKENWDNKFICFLTQKWCESE